MLCFRISDQIVKQQEGTAKDYFLGEIQIQEVVFSAYSTEHLRSHGRRLLDFSGDFDNDALRGDSRTHGNRNQAINEERFNPGSEVHRTSLFLGSGQCYSPGSGDTSGRVVTAFA